MAVWTRMLVTNLTPDSLGLIPRLHKLEQRTDFQKWFSGHACTHQIKIKKKKILVSVVLKLVNLWCV